MVIKFCVAHYFQLWMDVGLGSNIRAQLLTLWELLKYVFSKNLLFMQVINDSRVILDQSARKANLQVALLDYQKEKIKDLQSNFKFFLSIRHFDSLAYHLSKKAIQKGESWLFYEELLDHEVVSTGSYQAYQIFGFLLVLCFMKLLLAECIRKHKFTSHCYCAIGFVHIYCYVCLGNCVVNRDKLFCFMSFVVGFLLYGFVFS